MQPKIWQGNAPVVKLRKVQDGTHDGPLRHIFSSRLGDPKNGSFRKDNWRNQGIATVAKAWLPNRASCDSGHWGILSNATTLPWQNRDEAQDMQEQAQAIMMDYDGDVEDQARLLLLFAKL